ncbi:MAG: cupin domain-containing protein [Actinomycetota bacterium]|nr:cupin domain-containing protein [Actinomycetota bacterium]
MDLEVFRAENPPQSQRYGEALEAGIVRGNMGSLVVFKLGPGLELAEHAHEQEHVGAVLAGEFSFTDGDEQTVLRAGDLYRVPPNVRHGVRCADHALVVQARADFEIARKT